jgi:Protein of unknown function (DUF3052)
MIWRELPEKDYSHRDVTDKLGVKPGHAVAIANEAGPVDAELVHRVIHKAGRPLAPAGEQADVVLANLDKSSDLVEVLKRWRERIVPNGGIWLLTPKRGQPGYVDQNVLIEAGKLAGVVDNKVCSVDERTSAMRFVIRREDRRR